MMGIASKYPIKLEPKCKEIPPQPLDNFLIKPHSDGVLPRAERQMRSGSFP
jgi:hypothetical protein